MRDIVIQPDLESWRAAARKLLAEGVAPDQVVWREAAKQGGLFEAVIVAERAPAGPPSDLRVPRAFVELAGAAARHSDPDRWRLLYSVLFRLVRTTPDLLASENDADLVRLRKLAKQI